LANLFLPTVVQNTCPLLPAPNTSLKEATLANCTLGVGWVNHDSNGVRMGPRVGIVNVTAAEVCCTLDATVSIWVVAYSREVDLHTQAVPHLFAVKLVPAMGSHSSPALAATLAVHRVLWLLSFSSGHTSA